MTTAHTAAHPPHRSLFAGLTLCLIGLILLTAYPTAAWAQSWSLGAQLNAPKGKKLTTVDVDDEDIRTVLMSLAQQAGINLVLDPWIEGKVTVSMERVSVNEAITALAAMAGLDIVPQPGNIYLLVPQAKSKEKGLSRRLTQVIKLKHVNAVRIAKVLNDALFTDPNANAQNGGAGGATASPTATPGAGGSTSTQMRAVRADGRTNSLIIVGNEQDLQIASQLAEQLDVAREARTYQLSYANAVNVAFQLNSSVFHDGINPIQMSTGGGSSGGGSSGGSSGGSGGSSGSGQQDAQPTSLRVTQEFIQEGVGINTVGNSTGTSSSSTTTGSSGSSSGTSGSTSGSSGASGGDLITGVSIRNIVKSTGLLNVSPMGPLIVPDTRLNAITILATPEQLAEAERLLPILDARPPQVSIEASLVEMSQTAAKDLGVSYAGQVGHFGWSFNNLSALGGSLLGVGQPLRGGSTTYAKNANVADTFNIQLNALIQEGKAKNLANPTVVATHDTETIINIADEIRRGSSFNVQSNGSTGGGFASSTPLIGQAGIVLDIIPKIGEDASVTMRIRPSISSVYSSTGSGVSLVQLLRRRDLVAQSVRVKDGNTLVIGGLVDSRDTRVDLKVPGLSDLPILGALMRQNTRNRNKSELVILLTPHILNYAQPTPIHRIDTPPEVAQAVVE